jgi:hypothetical protein
VCCGLGASTLALSAKSLAAWDRRYLRFHLCVHGERQIVSAKLSLPAKLTAAVGSACAGVPNVYLEGRKVKSGSTVVGSGARVSVLAQLCRRESNPKLPGPGH